MIASSAPVRHAFNLYAASGDGLSCAPIATIASGNWSVPRILAGDFAASLFYPWGKLGKLLGNGSRDACWEDPSWNFSLASTALTSIGASCGGALN
jgi:hypothetical protein